jgi:hypothetical protein
MGKGIVFTIMGVIILIGIGVAGIFLYPMISQSLGGFTTLSISNIEVINDGSFIRIYGVSNGAEALSISISPSQINSYIQDDGYEATNSVTGTITLDEQIKRFPIIKKLDQNFFELKTQKVGILSGCSTLDGYTYTGSIISLSINKVCFYKRGIGTNSDFSGQSIRDSSVSFNIAGATGILNPGSGTNTLTLNDGKTKIEWVGDLSNYNQITAPFSYSILFHESKFKKLIDDDSYALSQDEAIRFSTCMGKTSTASSVFSGSIFSFLGKLRTNSQIDSCINTYNNRVTNLLVDQTSSYHSSINSNLIGFTANALEVYLKTADAFPTFIITLPAEKVGIIELKGIPDIVSCVPSLDMDSGDSENPTLRVKNIGESDGSFFGSVSCSGSASASGIISEQYVRAGETTDMPIQVTGQNTIVDTTESASCKITIEDRKSERTDTCNFNVDVTYQSGIICEPDSVKCFDADTLRTCSEDGKSYEDEECEFGCKSFEDGTGECKVEDDDGDKECKWYESYREEGNKLFGIFPGKQAGCYTAGWVYLVIILIFISIIVIIFIGLTKIRRR